MSKQEFEYPNCWIRGQMDEKDYKDDPVRLETIRCPYRKGQIRPFLLGMRFEMDYDCTHPAGNNELRTFCIPVDMHLTSLGEKSQFVIEGKSIDVTDNEE